MCTRLTTLLLAAGIIAWTVVGCAQQHDSESPPTYHAPCVHPTNHELGFVRSAEGPWPKFRTIAGNVYLGVRGLDRTRPWGRCG